MDPQQIQQLQDAINGLNNSVSQMTTVSNLMAGAFSNAIRSMNNVDPTMRKLGDALGQSVRSTQQAGNAVQEEQRNAASRVQASSEAYADAASRLRQSALGAAGALSNVTASITNLSGVAAMAGDAVRVLGIKMGVAESTAGKLGNALQGTVGAVLSQTQSYLQAKDALSQLGAAGNQTVSSLFAYAHAAGLHADSVSSMINPIKALNANIMILGRGAGDAQKSFMEMLQVSDEQRQKFARLGILQDELMARQGDYVALQASSGISLRNQNMTMEQLRKASTEYVRNLYDLAALTGQDVNEIKDRQKALLNERRLMIENMQTQARILDLQKEAEQYAKDDPRRQALLDEAKQLQARNDAQNKFIAQLQQFGPDVTNGIIEYLTTGGISEAGGGAKLARAGMLPAMEEARGAIERGEDPQIAAEKFKEELSKQGYEVAKTIGDALQIGDVNLSAQYLMLPENMQQFAAILGRDLDKELKDQRERRRIAEEGGYDSAADLRAALQESSIILNQAADKLTQSINPFIDAFNLMSDSADALKIATENLRNPGGESIKGKGPAELSGFVDAVNLANQGLTGFTSMVDAVTGSLGKLYNGINTFLGKPLPEVRDSKVFGEKTTGGEGTSFPREQETVGTTQAPSGTEATAPSTTAPVQSATVPPIPVPTMPEEEKVGTAPQTALPSVEEPTQAPVTAPVTGQEQQKPTQAPVTAPVTGQQPQTPTQAPITDQQAPVSAAQTPVPNYQSISVDTSWGNKINLPGPAVAKVAQLIREGKSRPFIRYFLNGLIGKAPDGKFYNNNTIDKLIDKVANAANINPPAGSTVSQVATPSTPTDNALATPQGPQPSTEMQGSGPAQTAPPVQGRVSSPDNQRTPSASTNIPPNIAAPSSTAPSVTTEPKLQPMTLEQLAQQGLGEFFRGPQGKGKGKYDTQAPGAVLDSRLIDAARKLTETDLSPFTLRHITALNDEYHRKLDPNKWRDNTHKQGRAIDFTLDKKPKPEEFSQLEKTLQSIGFSTVKDRYNNTSAVDTGPHIHAEIPKMATGGIISGPKTGFPAILHGNEIVIPLDPKSLLADLGKKTADEFKSEMSTAEKTFRQNEPDGSEIYRNLSGQNKELMQMLAVKLDDVINKLDTSNSTQTKILRYSQV